MTDKKVLRLWSPHESLNGCVKNEADAMPTTIPDLGEAGRFLDSLEADGTLHFRTFADKKDDRTLTRKISGKFCDVGEQLAALNARGAGIFVVVNRGGQCGNDITRLRALFVDGDDIPLPPAFHLMPSIACARSQIRWHAYWLLKPDQPISAFKGAQKYLAAHYGTDPRIFDLPRVMRVPGFVHWKAEPVLLRVTHRFGRWYTIEEVVGAAKSNCAAVLSSQNMVTIQPGPRAHSLARMNSVVLDSSVDSTQRLLTAQSPLTTPLSKALTLRGVRDTTLRRVTFSRLCTVEEAVEVAATTKLHQNYDVLFVFARALKAVEHRRATPLTPAEEMGAFDKWYKWNQRFTRPGATREMYFDEFKRARACARLPLGENPPELVAIFERARASLPLVAEKLTTRTQRLLCSLCHHLQLHHGKNPFPLGCRKAAEFLGTDDYATAADVLRRLTRMGIIRVAKLSVGNILSRRYHYLPLIEGANESGGSMTT
ncbi:MAG TPA: hypothetical protein VKX17_13835 [Planctomycetota bacterium]|nr:hypothetical protein [Planctomycetota bacterium]